MNNTTLIQERQQLRDLLDTYSDEARALPSLKAEELPAWLRQMLDWWQAQKDTWRGWWEDMFGTIPTPNLPIDWPMVIQVAFGLMIAALITWLLYALIRRRAARPTGAQRLPIGAANDPTELQQALHAALASARWDVAARLRWRLFLRRLQLPPHVTPHEILDHAQYRPRWSQAQGMPVRDQYRVMFANEPGSQQWYDHYHGALTTLEDEPEHG